MIELEPSQFVYAAPLFQKTRYGALASGTLEGGHPGRIFCDNLDDPQVALVCTRVGYYFLAGSPADPQTGAAIRALFEHDLAPNQIDRIGDPQILLFYDRLDWEPVLLDLFQPWKPLRIQKKRMIPGPQMQASISSKRQQLPHGLRIAPVTTNLLKNHPEKAEEIGLFWGSIEAFLQKSLGVWILEGESLLSSVEAVFTGSGEAEISVATVPEARRRGLASIATAEFIAACWKRHLTPVWGCWPENAPSVALAHSLGFVEEIDHPVCLWEWQA